MRVVQPPDAAWQSRCPPSPFLVLLVLILLVVDVDVNVVVVTAVAIIMATTFSVGPCRRGRREMATANATAEDKVEVVALKT